MISYTITLPLTVGEVRLQSTIDETYGYTWESFNGDGFGLLFDETREETWAYKNTYFTGSDGGRSISGSDVNFIVYMQTLDGLTGSATFSSIYYGTTDSNGGATTASTYAYQHKETLDHGSSFGTSAYNNSDSNEASGETNAVPITISGLTTSLSEAESFISTTGTQDTFIICGTTVTVLPDFAHPTAQPYTYASITYTQTQTTVQSVKITNRSFTTIVSTEFPGVFQTFDDNGTVKAISQPYGPFFPLRDTGTVLVTESNNQVVWHPTATKVGPIAKKLSELASSYSIETTLVPFYETNDLTLIAFKDVFTGTDPAPPISLTYAALTENNQDTTVWEPNWEQGTGILPLVSRKIVKNVVTTTKETFEVTQFVDRPDTETFLSFGTESTASLIAANHLETFHSFYNGVFTKTRLQNYIITGDTSSSTSGRRFLMNPYTDGPIVSQQRSTKIQINGKTCQKIYLTSFNPCVVYQSEKQYSYAWGIFNDSSPLPVAKISVTPNGNAPFISLAEVHPGVQVLHPTEISWGDPKTTARILGNTVTKIDTSSETYLIQGEGDPWITQQIDLYQNFSISAFGPHAALEIINTRVVPGTYISINQNSLGDYSLQTIVYTQTSSADISKNAILFPAENSFYTTSAKNNVIFLPRNPIP